MAEPLCNRSCLRRDAARLAGLAVPVALLLCGPARAETLAQFLETRKLEDLENPVPITYLLEQAPPTLDAKLHEQALQQAQEALRHQTSAMNKIGESMSGAFSSPTMHEINRQASQQMTTTSVAKQMLLGHFGVQQQQHNPTPRQIDQLQRELRTGMTDPWIRGLESARALERVGNAQAAGRYYMNCIQSAPPDFLADSCLNGILGMGPQRAYVLLAWLAEHAEEAALGGVTTTGGAGAVAVNVVWLRGAALRGLGTLRGSGMLNEEQAAATLRTLLAYARGKEHEPYFADAADGLGRARATEGAEPLRELARAKDPATAQAALRALAVGLHDAAATARLRQLLDDRDAAVQLRAADALLDAGDEAGLSWAREVITSKRDPDSGRTDLRPRVVRDLVARGDDRSRATLQGVLQQGAGNDFLQAWVAVGLLEMGDRAQLEPALAAVGRRDWTLDRPGVKSLWQQIRPLVQLAAQAAMGPVAAQQMAKVIVNFALAERARAGERATDRELANLQIRWQVCDALATLDDPRATAQLAALLADPEPAVRLSAARALALQPSSAPTDGLVKAFHADFGAADGASRTPEVRAALLRTALARAPTDPRTRELAREAARDADPGVRFIGLMAQGP
jgi:HEAT repeat protein